MNCWVKNHKFVKPKKYNMCIFYLPLSHGGEILDKAYSKIAES